MPTPLALVVGVGPGIGLAVARRFAREGFRIALVARQAGDLETFRAPLLAAGAPDVLALAGDVAEAPTLRRVFEHLRAEGLEPEVLIYNASLGHPAPPSRLSPGDLLRQLQANVVAALECAQAVLPAMRAAGRGTLLFTGGGLALAPKAGEAGLSIGKAGLRTLALTLAEELAPEGLHAATVTVAGFVRPDTPFNAETISETFWELHAEPRARWRHEVVLTP